jgi:hypothetical protein
MVAPAEHPMGTAAAAAAIVSVTDNTGCRRLRLHHQRCIEMVDALNPGVLPEVEAAAAAVAMHGVARCSITIALPAGSGCGDGCSKLLLPGTLALRLLDVAPPLPAPAPGALCTNESQFPTPSHHDCSTGTWLGLCEVRHLVCRSQLRMVQYLRAGFQRCTCACYAVASMHIKYTQQLVINLVRMSMLIPAAYQHLDMFSSQHQDHQPLNTARQACNRHHQLPKVRADAQLWTITRVRTSGQDPSVKQTVFER